MKPDARAAGGNGLVKVPFYSYEASVPSLLDELNAGDVFSACGQVLIKPNLVNDSPPPVTTPVECCEAAADYIRSRSSARIIIAEGCGAAGYETDRVFEKLGYAGLSRRKGIPLVDLNRAELAEVERAGCRVFPRMRLPKIAFESFILSMPVLKAHSLAGITGTLKNMMGFAPPSDCRRGGCWKKSFFHARMHESIIELNRYLTPSLTVLDASVGLAEHHLGGAECEPPAGVLLGGWDPVETDRAAAGLLGFDWRAIPHLSPDFRGPGKA